MCICGNAIVPLRRVALGSTGVGSFLTAVGSEKGRKGAESSSSSSASESDPRGFLELEYRGRRMYARLRDSGGAASDSDDEELEKSILLDELAFLSTEDILSLAVASDDFRDSSRALPDCPANNGDSGSYRWLIVGEPFDTW